MSLFAVVNESGRVVLITDDINNANDMASHLNEAGDVGCFSVEPMDE